MKIIPLTQGRSAKVDDADFEALSQFHWGVVGRDGNQYVYRYGPVVGGRRTRIRLHHAVMRCSPPQLVDHKDRDPFNNQTDNLRMCSQRQNCQNKTKRKNTSSQFKGVTRHGGKWCARIWASGGNISLGKFSCELEAARAYDAAATLHFGEFACINFKNAA